ncbi:MAG: ATP-binding protein [Rickettsiales bacterium]
MTLIPLFLSSLITSNRVLSEGVPLTWHLADNPYQSFTAQGSQIYQPNEQLIEKLNNDHQLLMYDRLENNGEVSIIMIVPAVEQSLIGFFELQIKISSILQTLYDGLADDDLIKISSEKQSLYFSKQDEIFMLDKDPSLQGYSFAKEMNFSPASHKITIAQQVHPIIINTIQDSFLRCIAILSLGSLMLLIYNYIERKKIKHSYNETFSKELLLNQEQMKDLAVQLIASNNDAEKLTKQNHHYLDTNRVVTNLEQQINQYYTAALLKIRDSNRLLLKHYSKQKELDIEVVEKLFASIDGLCEDLRYNIFNRDDKITEIEVVDIFAEVLCLFTPIITSRSITIINKIGKAKIKINELIFKQILISLLAKVVYSLPKEKSLTIITQQGQSKNRITIEISDNGLGISENLIEDVLLQKKNNLLPGITRIQFNLETIESLVKESLGGDITISSSNQGNNIILLLPLEVDRNDNVIPMPKIAVR